MVSNLTFWHILGILGAFFAFFAAFIGALVRMWINQFEQRANERMQNIEKFIDERFSSISHIRSANGDVAQARLDNLRLEINQIKDEQNRIRGNVVHKETWMDHIGSVNNRLDSIMRRLAHEQQP